MINFFVRPASEQRAKVITFCNKLRFRCLGMMRGMEKQEGKKHPLWVSREIIPATLNFQLVPELFFFLLVAFCLKAPRKYLAQAGAKSSEHYKEQ